MDAYSSFVKPILNYAAPVWTPIVTTIRINKLEAIQKRAARFITTDYQRTSSVAIRYAYFPTVAIRGNPT